MIELVFGVKSDDQEMVANHLGSLLSLNFEEHDSAYAGSYFLAHTGESEFRIKDNLAADYDDQPEDEKEYNWIEEKHKECPILLWFDLANNNVNNEIKQKLNSSKLNLVFIRELEY